MEYKKLGATGTIISKLCLGTMNFGMVTNCEEAFNIMDCAVDYGINYFDTSNSYGGYTNRGQTEKIIGKWFKTNGKRNRVFLADKVYHLSEKSFFNPNDEKGISAYKMRRHLEESLTRLETDHIDLYQIHHEVQDICYEELWDEFERMYVSGLVTYFGSSNFSAHDITKCNMYSKYVKKRMGLVSEQHRYNLLCRYPELEVMQACRKEDISFIAWGPLAAGILSNHMYDKTNCTRSSHNNVDEATAYKMEKYLSFCDNNGVNPSQLALAWILDNPNVTSVIIGPRNVEQLKSSIGALDIDVSQYKRELDKIFPGFEKEAPEYYAW